MQSHNKGWLKIRVDKKSTYPKKADEDPQWKKEEISHNKTEHPYDG